MAQKKNQGEEGRPGQRGLHGKPRPPGQPSQRGALGQQLRQAARAMRGGGRSGARTAEAPRGGGRRTVADLMTRDPAMCTPGTRIHEAAQLMRDHDCGALPVVESLDNPVPVGVVTDRDLVVRGLAEPARFPEMLVVDVMTAEPATVREGEPLEGAIRVLMAEKIRRVIVVDDYGRCTGMLAQADLAQSRDERTQDVVEAVSSPGEEDRVTP
jgi:CBS domain-containing protein